MTFRFDMRLTTPCRITHRFTLLARQLGPPLLAPALPPTPRVYMYLEAGWSKKLVGWVTGEVFV